MILYQDTGRLCNRLVSASYCLAFALEHDLTFINLCFWRYQGLYEPIGAWRHPWLHRTRYLTSSLLEQVLELKVCAPIRARFVYDERLIVDPMLICRRIGSALLSRFLCEGMRVPALGLQVRNEKAWDHHCHLLVEERASNFPVFSTEILLKHQTQVKAVFQPMARHSDAVNCLMTSLRGRYDRLVGVHIRREDYCRYNTGKWMLSIKDYAQAMHHIAEEFVGDKVGFVIASSSPLVLSEFDGLSVCSAPGHLLEDNIALSRCDMIVGPPSTYSGWASFSGNVPIRFIEANNLLPSRHEFTESWVPRFY